MKISLKMRTSLIIHQNILQITYLIKITFLINHLIKIRLPIMYHIMNTLLIHHRVNYTFSHSVIEINNLLSRRMNRESLVSRENRRMIIKRVGLN